jgi:hypothetical protein
MQGFSFPTQGEINNKRNQTVSMQGFSFPTQGEINNKRNPIQTACRAFRFRFQTTFKLWV